MPSRSKRIRIWYRIVLHTLTPRLAVVAGALQARNRLTWGLFMGYWKQHLD